MEEHRRLDEPLAFGASSSVTVGVSLRARLGVGDTPKRALQIVIVPRIRAEIYRRKDDLDWLAPEASADVERLAGEIEDVLLALAP